MKHIIPFFLAAVMFNSCGIYKKYERPEVVTDSLYRHSPMDTTSLASLSWKELFTDPLLQELIDSGLQTNTDINVAKLKVDEAIARLTNAKLSYLPSVNLTPEGSISRFSGQTTKTYNLGLTADWELDIFGKVTNAKRAALADLNASRAYVQAVQTQLISTIANSYYSLLMLDAQRENGMATKIIWNKTIQTLSALKKAGKSNEAAVLQAQANLHALEISIAGIERNITEVENALTALIGSPNLTIRRSNLSLVELPDTLMTGLPLQLLSNRPDVQEAEYNLMRAFYATNQARSAFYPSITLAGTIGWTNNGGIVSNPGGWLLNAIASLTQPLFNKGTNIANLKIAQAQQEQAKLLFQQSLLDAGKEVNDALAQWQTASGQLEMNDRQIEALEEAVRKIELLMKYTPTTYLEVLTAQQSLLAAQQSKAQYQFERIQGVINLYHALGGGR